MTADNQLYTVLSPLFLLDGIVDRVLPKRRTQDLPLVF